MKLKLRWMPETIARGHDANVGAALYQVTSAAMISHNIYCEERYTSTDGGHLAFLRSSLGQEGEALWLHETGTAHVAKLCDSIWGYPTSTIYSDELFYVRCQENGERILVRLDLKKLEQEDVFNLSPCPTTRYPVCAVSPDGHYWVGKFHAQDEMWGLYRVDLRRGDWEVFHEHEGICNPHPQFEPSRGNDILVQWNRGSLFDAEENAIRWAGESGATLYVIDRNGGNLRPLPVGKPHTGSVTGHECWVGDSGDVILTIQGSNRGDIHLVTPGAQASRCLWSGLAFNHISVSTDGRFFITDDVDNARIYVGSIATGRMLPLCDSGASYSSPQYTHPHAYMTPDNQRVIFNSDRTGLCQVWCTDVPAGFLEALALPQA